MPQEDGDNLDFDSLRESPIWVLPKRRGQIVQHPERYAGRSKGDSKERPNRLSGLRCKKTHGCARYEDVVSCSHRDRVYRLYE